jgi:hypothetical protein
MLSWGADANRVRRKCLKAGGAMTQFSFTKEVWPAKFKSSFVTTTETLNVWGFVFVLGVLAHALNSI